jgi:hypothetical protein
MLFSQTGIWILLAAIALVALLFQERRFIESANGVAADCCRQNTLQLLDGTVAFAGFSLLWRQRRLCRRYRFEYSTDGADRHQGAITLHGKQAVAFHINPEHLGSHQFH